MTNPETQAMVDGGLGEITRILGPEKGFLMRQKLDVLEIFCPMLQKRNKYKVAKLPEGKGDDASDWEDKTFKKALKKGGIFTIKEESDLCCRLCCGPFREFRAKVTTSKKAGGEKQTVAYFHRPFKCTMYCVFCALFPQEITTEDASGKELGKTVQDYRFIDACCGKRKWAVHDGDGNKKYIIEDNICCNANMCAPSCFCPVRKLDILDGDDESKVVGSIMNIFPGCNMRGFFGTADNYKLVFPEDADPAMKMQFMASMVLIDFMLFEKSENEQNGGEI